MRYLKVLILFLFIPLMARAQFYVTGDDPGRLRWNYIDTESYRVIYPQGADSLARVYGRKLEKYKIPVSRTSGYVTGQGYKKVSNTEKLAGLIIKVIKIWGIIILACLIVAVVGIVLFGFVRGEGSVEFENNVEKVTFTEVVGEETYIITIGSDGYFEGIGMSDEIKEELMELIVVGDLPTSEDNITDYFIKLREGTQQETP